jgi:diguanylate cyclase (GGDEF)-like protein
VGGEEFLVLSPGVDAEGVLALGERIRSTVERAVLQIDGETLRLTVSIGTAVAGPGEWDMPTLRRRADAALYAAKRAGRNQVMAGGEVAT